MCSSDLAPPGAPDASLVLPVLLMLWSTQEHKNFLLMYTKGDSGVFEGGIGLEVDMSSEFIILHFLAPTVSGPP